MREQLDHYPSEVAAAEFRGRAAGWREAIEALRDDHRYREWYQAKPEPRTHLDLVQAYVAADFLESLAPKETP